MIKFARLAAIVLAPLTLAGAVAAQNPTDSMRIDFGVRIPMRDGITLVADVSHPASP